MDLAAFTDDELDRLRVQVAAEQEARALAASAPSSAAALVDAVASGRAVDPTTVTRDGRTYTLAVQEQADPQGPPEWDAKATYKAGAEVTEAGRRYTATADSTGKQPSVSPTFWHAL